MAVDFTLTQDQLAERAAAREFAEKHLAGVERLIAGIPTPEERLLATRPIYREMVRAGYLKAMIPADLGGTFRSVLDLVIVGEEISHGDMSVSCGLFSSGLGFYPVLIGGSPEQRRRFLAPFLADDGTPMAALAFSEDGGSANFDAPEPSAGFTTTARRDGDEWVISGRKAFTTNGYGWEGEGPEFFSVACRVGDGPSDRTLSVIVVPGDSPGISYGPSLDTMGHRACLSPRVVFDEVRVPVENMIGRPGDGIDLLTRTFAWSGVTVGAEAVCVMQQAFDAARAFAVTERRRGAVPVIEHQNVAYMLADIKMRLEAARYLVWKAAHRLDETQGADMELSNMAKVHCSELAVQVVYDAMRLVGVESYADERPFARMLQDALALPLYDGGNMGIRRRAIGQVLAAGDYDSRAAAENRLPSHSRR
ncbi:acyl-CoA dehydrogenase family protein [Streptomyces sp. NPDC005811]|uniref:acyl-CoA dehydrogenase family protein n=1 Tax=Streptomyces sp. NPDC005811 TaxID=3154565 RepID=UPI0033C6EC6F